MTPNPPQKAIIYTNDAPRRHAPLATTGILGWLRSNLFPTWFDTLLTIVSAFAIIVGLTGLIQWTISGANWYSVTRNLSNLMIGSLQADPIAVARVNMMTLLLAFGIGVSLRAWSRVGSRGWLGVAIAALLLLIVPIAVTPIPLPASLVTSGSISIVSGSVTEIPQNAMSLSKGESVLSVVIGQLRTRGVLKGVTSGARLVAVMKKRACSNSVVGSCGDASRSVR